MPHGEACESYGVGILSAILLRACQSMAHRLAADRTATPTPVSQLIRRMQVHRWAMTHADATEMLNL